MTPPMQTLHHGSVAPPPALKDWLVDIKNLSLRYREKTVLRDIHFKIHEKSITAVLGPSGCGKTSFLSCLNRLIDLIPGACVSGEVWMHNENLLSPQIDVVRLRRRVGMIFQKPNPFPFSIRRNLQLPLWDSGVKNKTNINERSEIALRAVGLWEQVKDRLDRPALQLSGGQQQRLCIARALVLEPEVLLFDEPCSALDPISSGVVEDLIVELKKNKTIVVVTHNIAQAKRIADDVALFWVQDGSGLLIEHGRAQKIFDEPTRELTATYLSGARG